MQDYVDRAKLAVADGYDAIKIDFLNWDEKGRILNETNRLGLLPPDLVEMFSNRVHAVREAIGPNVDLIIENHAGTNSDSAIQLSAAVQDCNIYYFEEPNTPVFYNNKYVKDNIRMPPTLYGALAFFWPVLTVGDQAQICGAKASLLDAEQHFYR